MLLSRSSIVLALLALPPSTFASPRKPLTPNALSNPPFAPYANSTTASPTNNSINASTPSTSITLPQPSANFAPAPHPMTLRIESPSHTLFSAPLLPPILALAMNITTPSSPTPHHCNASTPITALAAANASEGFTYDALFYSYPYDIYGSPREAFIVTRIGNDSQTPTSSWQAAVNYAWVPVGQGCEVEVSGGGVVVWAYGGEFEGMLRLFPNGAVGMRVGESLEVVVIDGVGRPVPYVLVTGGDGGGSAVTDEDGQAHLRFLTTGNFTFVAEREGWVRSETLVAVVGP
ncbi:hypothetical protein MMC30_000075 [Trapelia coarctata]|nr:hypothetical protein [Trapelia coarctata]